MKKLACFILLVCFSLPRLDAASLPSAVSPLTLLMGSILSLAAVTGSGLTYYYYKNKKKQVDLAKNAVSDLSQIDSHLSGGGKKPLDSTKEGALEEILSEQGSLDQKSIPSDAEQLVDDEDSQDDELLMKIKAVNNVLAKSVERAEQAVGTPLSDSNEVDVESSLISESLGSNNKRQAEEVQQLSSKADDIDPHAVSAIYLDENENNNRKLALENEKQLTTNLRQYAKKKWDVDDLTKRVGGLKTEINQLKTAISKTQLEIDWNLEKQERSLEQNEKFQKAVDECQKDLVANRDDYLDDIDEDSPKYVAYREMERSKEKFENLQLASTKLIAIRGGRNRYLNELLVKRGEQGRKAEAMLEKLEPELSEQKLQLQELEQTINTLNTRDDQWLETEKQQMLAQTKPSAGNPFKRFYRYIKDKPDSPYEYNPFYRLHRYIWDFGWQKI